MSKRIKWAAVVVFLLLFPLTGAEWPNNFLPADQVKPGQRGYLKTVFYGEAVEQVDLEIVSVMNNYYPHRDVIVARLLGEKAERNGVVSGMSGSPVYIDDRLIGAVAYRFGEFMKEPIVGITPIAEMIEIEQKELQRSEPARRSAALFDKFMQAVQIGADSLFWIKLLKESDTGSESSAGLRRITCPLSFGGFSSATLQGIEPVMQNLGFQIVMSGGSGGENRRTPLSPGSAVCVVFMTGDYTIEATGTVTAVAGNKVLAFGHSLFNLGPISLPLAGATVYATLPSLMASSKMAAATEVLGTFVQDRTTGALGDLSRMPRMVPIQVAVESPQSGLQTFSFQLADDPAFNNILPLFLRTAVIQAAFSTRLGGEQSSCRLEGQIRLADGRSVPFDDHFSSRQRLGFIGAGEDVASAADLVASALGTLMVHDFPMPRIEAVQLKLTSFPKENYLTLESVRTTKMTVQPGDTLIAAAVLRDNRNNRREVRQQLIVPKNLTAERLSLIVSSAAPLSNYEMQNNRGKYVPKDFDHLLKLINERRKPQMLFFQLRVEDESVAVRGKELTNLPPSVAGMINSNLEKGAVVPLRDRAVLEEAVACGSAVTGGQRLTLRVKAPAESRKEEPKRDAADRLYRLLF